MGAEAKHWIKTNFKDGKITRVFPTGRQFNAENRLRHLSPQQQTFFSSLAHDMGLDPQETKQTLRQINRVAGEATIPGDLSNIGKNIIGQAAKKARTEQQ